MFVNSILCFVLFIHAVKGDYAVPPLSLQALKKGGFRVYITDDPGTAYFAFHANINDNIRAHQVGTVNSEARAPTNGFWILEFNDKLKLGDVVNYWIFVNANNRGYRMEGERIKITQLLDKYTEGEICETASTVINGGKRTCLDNVIFQDKFEGTAINTMLWKVEHKIPTYFELNSPFNSYENREDTRYIKNNLLHLKPNALTESEVRGTLDLRDGCTGIDLVECFYEQRSSFLIPPVKSSKVVSTTSFKYGKVEIRAQLPRGDWIFPVVQLEFAQRDNVNPQKIWIAYSRGNTNLVIRDPNNIDVRGFNGVDIGGRLLLAGPMVEVAEPKRSQRLVYKYGDRPFSDGFHTYGLLWTKDKMRFYVDSEEYGSVDMSTENFDGECVLSLGVGVGGVFDFPEGVVSGNNLKPWANEDKQAIKRFFERKPEWHRTWDDEKSCLIVDHVQVTAV